MLANSFVVLTALYAAPTAIAQSQAPALLSLTTSALIKRYDPVVTSVQLVSPATPGKMTACGKMPAMNAIYCPADKTVYMGADFMSKSYEEHGVMAPIVITAHEYAHARQHGKTGFIRPLGYSVANELQADCLAGVYLKNASPVQFTESQIEKASIFVHSLGDYHFFSRDWHGTPGMRSKVFKYGYATGNMNNCIAGDEANWNRILSNGRDSVREILDTGADIIGPALIDLFDYIKQ